MMGYKWIPDKAWADVNQKLRALTSDIASATEFVREIERGNLDVSIGANATDSELRTSLVNMRDQMKRYALTEKQRNWVNEGLAKFVHILRSTNIEARQDLSDNIIRNLVIYLKANQGALFALNDDDPKDIFLEMEACYAYDRKKYLEKRIALGEGLAGQVVLEKSTLYMTDVPKDFVKITSGLGEALPRNILLVPLKLEEKIYGVVEIASFQVLESYEIEFVEKLGESIASTISAVKNSDRTRKLLKETQLQAEQLKAQEEEVRQNLEELSATQEAMQRAMKEVEGKEAYMAQVLNTSQDVIYTVDREFRMVTWNSVFRREAERINVKVEKGMNAFEWAPEERKKLTQLYAKVFQGETFEMNYDIDLGGKRYYFLTVYAPLREPSGEIVEAAIYARNVTQVVEAQQESARLLKEAQEQSEQLKAQEEELRQNMEELAATQESMEQKAREAEARERYISGLLNVSHDVIFTVDHEFKLVLWNDSFGKSVKALGVQPEKGMIAFGWRVEAERQFFAKQFERVFNDEAFEIIVESKYDGRTHYFLSSFAPLRNADGKVIEAAVFGRDITATKEAQLQSEKLAHESQQQAEELKAQEEELRQNMEELASTQEQMASQYIKLQESEQLTRTILDTSPFGIIRLDAQGVFLFYNEHMRQLLGLTHQNGSLHYSSVFKALKLEKLKAGERKRTKIFPVHGNAFMAEVIISALQEDFLLFIRDVTLEIQQQQEIVRSLEQAEMLKRTLLERQNINEKELINVDKKNQSNGRS